MTSIIIEVTRSRRLGVSAGEVWAALADFGSVVAWAPDVDHSCLLSNQTEGVGTARRVQIGRTTLVERVTEWDEPTTVSYAIEGIPPFLRSVVNRWLIEPVDGGALVTVTSEIEPGPRPLHRLAAQVAGRRLASSSEAMLAGLDRHLAASEAA